jgi:DNA polymerase-3 subunit delta
MTLKMNSKKKNKYIIAGSDFFLDSEIKKIVNQFDEPEVCHFHSDEINLEELYSFVFSLSLFGSDKIAIVFKSEKLNQFTQIAEKVAQATDTVVIFVFNESKKIKNLSTDFTIITESKLSIKSLIINMFSSKGFAISEDTANNIYDLCLKDMNIVKHEVEKVEIFFYGEKETPSEEQILDLISFNKNETVFTFIDSFMKKNKNKCLLIYNNILLSGENINMLFFLLAKRIQNAFLYLTDKSFLKINSWLLNKTKSDTKIWDISEIDKMLGLISDIDYEVKIGKEKIDNGILRLISTLN